MPSRRLALSLAVALVVLAAVYLLRARPLPLGSIAQPGPGFFPAAVGALLAVLSLLHLTAVCRGWCDAAEALPRGADRRRVLLVVGALVFFGAAVGALGYLISGIALSVVVLLSLGTPRVLAALLFAVIVVGASYYVFVSLLGVPLPKGWLLGS